MLFPLLVFYLLGVAVFGTCFMLAVWVTGRPENIVIIIIGIFILEWPLVVTVSVLCCTLLLSLGGPLWIAERFGWVKEVHLMEETP